MKLRKPSTSARLLATAVHQGAAGDVESGCATGRRALAEARSIEDRASALSYLTLVEPSPFVRYRLARELARLQPASPDAWDALYRSATECGFHHAATNAQRIHSAALLAWERDEKPRLLAEWDRIKKQDPALYKRIMDRREK